MDSSSYRYIMPSAKTANNTASSCCRRKMILGYYLHPQYVALCMYESECCDLSGIEEFSRFAPDIHLNNIQASTKPKVSQTANASKASQDLVTVVFLQARSKICSLKY